MDPAPNLHSLLSIDIIFRLTAPYIPLPALLSLSATSRPLRALLLSHPCTFSHLDLRLLPAATLPQALTSTPLDRGGQSFRAARIDEALTEDEFYSGPLRGVFARLDRLGARAHVATLVLDGLSVPAELVREVLADWPALRVLSLRRCEHLNERLLGQVLRYAVRAGRAEGWPRVRGVYVFGKPDGKPGLRGAEMARLGGLPVVRTPGVVDENADAWYRREGVVMNAPLQDWGETLAACQGIIHFDAVLCRGPRHDFSKAGSNWLGPAVATVSLGGCADCGSCPEGAAVFGQHDETAFPLLAPPPLHSTRVKEAQRPYATVGKDGITRYPPLILRCPECLRNRRCSTCNKWWCEACYQPPRPAPSAHVRADGHIQFEYDAQLKSAGVHRECWDCGLNCAECNSRNIKTCRICQSEFCYVHNGGKRPDECDWCGSSGRRTRELY